jgi:hypothetical protein
MGRQVIKQPNGLYAIYSSFSEAIEEYDLDGDMVCEFFAQEASERARAEARRILAHVADDRPEKAYFQFTMTWAEALADDRDHGGWVHTDVHGTDLDVPAPEEND